MLGELDYTDILVDRIVNNDTVPGTDLLYVPLPALTVTLFFIFVLMVSVVLVNLLVSMLRPLSTKKSLKIGCDTIHMFPVNRILSFTKLHDMDESF